MAVYQGQASVGTVATALNPSRAQPGVIHVVNQDNTNKLFGAYGGGGGGGTSVGNAGGNAVLGGGGGGGNGHTNGTSAGAGGNGGDGRVVVVCF